jgi:hypothetical protein
MTTGYSMVADLNGYFNQVYDDAVFVARDRNIMASLVTVFNDRTGDEDRISLQYPQAIAQSIAEGVDYANPLKWDKQLLSRLTPGEIITQSIITDRRIETDPQSAQADCSKELGEAIADKIEGDLLGVFNSLTGGTIGSGSGTTMTWGHLFAARARLRAGKVPGPYIAVLHEYHWHALAKALAPGASLVQSPAVMVDDIASQWYVGSVAGIDIYTTANIGISGNAAYSALYNRSAMAFDSRRAPRMEPQRDASLRAWEFNITAKYAFGVWRPAFGCQLYFDAAAPTS